MDSKNNERYFGRLALDEEGEKMLRGIIHAELRSFFGLSMPDFDGANLERIARIAAGVDSALFAEANMIGVPKFASATDLLAAAMKQATLQGLTLEFGVYSAYTLNHIASQTTDKVFGFDSFEGLPEDWRPDIQKGAFRRGLPEVRSNVELVVGWFDQTLPGFLEEHHEKVSFLHVDCDLYSSTKTIFDACADRIVSGTVIVFDEYFNYVGWRQHEYKAFMEFIEKTGHTFRYIGYVPSHQQVAVIID